ncbi:MAG: HAD hydrolase-like protein [Firmicutes bacterium]|nr:HAD hydrolase-like protein [Bacillota bacterium]
MIGDNPAADIAGGKTAGLRTVLVRHESAEGAFKNPDPCGADFVCRNLAEIPALLG